MMEKKGDRRVQMTRRMIKESFLELMQDYPISKVTVKMICESADINRSTFYAHYLNPYDLLNQIQQETLSHIQTYIMNKHFIIEKNKVAVPTLVQVLDFAKNNRSLFRVLLSESNSSNFQKGLESLANEKTIEEIAEEERLDRNTYEYLQIFEISGIISIMKTWLNKGCVDEPEELALLISKLLFQGIGGFYQ